MGERKTVDARWQMLVVLFLARTVLGFQFQTIASTESELRRVCGIGFAEVGTLIGFYMLPGILLALPGGLLVRRFGDKVVCCTGLALMAIGGILIGLSHSYGSVLTGRLISGIGGVFLSLSITKMVTDWFVGREIVTAMSVMLTSWPFGIAAGLLLYAPVAQAYGWTWVMHVAAGACLLALALIAGLYRSPTTTSAQAGPGPIRPAFTLPPRQEAVPVIVAGLAWGALNLGLIAFFSFVPPLLVTHGFSSAEGSSITSLALWLTLISMPVGGVWLQRRGRPEGAIILFSVLVGIAITVLSLHPAAALPLAIATGLLIGPPPGAIMAMPGRALRPENRAVGLGLFLTVYYVAVALGPVLAGILRDAHGPSAPVLFGAALFLAIAPLTALFRAPSIPAPAVARVE